MDPANFPKLKGVHPGWVTDAWPKDIILDRAGQWVPGWKVQGKDGEWYPCGVLCDRQALAYAQRRIPAELQTTRVHLPFHRHDHRLAVAGVL